MADKDEYDKIMQDLADDFQLPVYVSADKEYIPTTGLDESLGVGAQIIVETRGGQYTAWQDVDGDGSPDDGKPAIAQYNSKRGWQRA